MLVAELRAFHQTLHDESERLAGALPDLERRATVYHHLYRESGGNHAFPVIAAHGALWAGGYFRFGLRLGAALSWQFAFDPAERQAQLQRLNDFADALREINRRVCVDTFANYHFTARFGDDVGAAEVVPHGLLDALQRLHAARRASRNLHRDEKRLVFLAHFLHEQEFVVGPRIAAALDAFTWPLVRAIALRPSIRFAFFPGGSRLWFRNFADAGERIENGLRAFELAERAGRERVETTLDAYRILPLAFFTDEGYFERKRREWLQAA